MALEDRIENLERSRKPARDIHIFVEYHDTVVDEDGTRHESPIKSTYAEVDWNQIQPDATGDRIAVSYPIDDVLQDPSCGHRADDAGEKS